MKEDERGGRRKGISAVDILLGHKVNNRMTVIGGSLRDKTI